MVVRNPNHTQLSSGSRTGSPRPASIHRASDGPSLAGTIIIDHRFLSTRNARSLNRVWPGSVVQLTVQDRWPDDVAPEIHNLLVQALVARRLHLQVAGEPDVVEAWLRYLHPVVEDEKRIQRAWSEIR